MSSRGSKARSMHWWIGVALGALGSVTMLALAVQGFSSQALVEHPIWHQVLESFTRSELARRTVEGHGASQSQEGALTAWFVSEDDVPPGMPGYLQDLAPGFHSTEGYEGLSVPGQSFHALVTAVGDERLVAVLDIAAFEAQQNRLALINGAWGLLAALLIAALVLWLHWNLVRPVRELARRIGAIDARVQGERLPVDFRQSELQVIAQASNAHLERVENFVARERSLLEQASHEFRTPVAVISGGVDLLEQAGLPDSARPAMRRIRGALENLSETMVALLYVSREPYRGEATEAIALHDLIPVLVLDHEPLFMDKPLEVRVGDLQHTLVHAPEPMLRIAIGNLLRNAIENTAVGHIDISLQDGVVCILDSGAGFDAAEAARRYRDSLRDARPGWGQGLGMFIVARICDRFGWKLQIESQPGSGSKVRLDLSASV